MTTEQLLFIGYCIAIAVLVALNIIETRKRRKGENYLQICLEYVKWETARKSNWVLDPAAEIIIVDERKCYYALDGIRLIIEDGHLVGWYRPGEKA